MLDAAALVDVLDHQLAELVTAHRVIEQDREDRPVPLGFQGLALRCLEQVPDLGVGQGGVLPSYVSTFGRVTPLTGFIGTALRSQSYS